MILPLTMIFAAGVCIAVDGDTIKCKGERIRLVRINAPEKDEIGGSQSTDWMQTRIEGNKVHCYIGGRDKYRRLLAECFAGDSKLSISDESMAAGMAERYSGRRK